ncbi:MAG: type secretion system protein [Cyanobacteria bacterium RYN_339]|nr:type secretion system protein [Cyanobacteria bacterium RYN_339]
MSETVLPAHRAAFYEQLGRQLKAGLPLGASFRNLVAPGVPAPIARAVEDARPRLEAGEALAAVLARHPNAFPPHDIGYLHAAELAGTLPLICQQLGKEYRLRHNRTLQLAGQLVYPGILLVLSVLLLPIPRAFVDGVGAYFMDALPGILGICLAAGGTYWLAFAPGASQLRARLGAIAQQIPWVGTQLRAMAIARTVNLLAVCLGAGLNAPDAFRAAAKATTDVAIAAACQDIAMRLGGGKATISEAVGAHPDVFDGTAFQVIATGEESGTLDASLARLGEGLEEGAIAALGMLFTMARYGVLVAVVLNIGWRILGQMLQHLHAVNQAMEGL